VERRRGDEQDLAGTSTVSTKTDFIMHDVNFESLRYADVAAGK
jgi:hypothetical protein